VLNHLQDCGKDLAALDRSYLPEDLLRAAGAAVPDVSGTAETPGLRRVFALLLDEVDHLNDAAEALPRRTRAWRLRVEVYRALGFEGELRVEDPDGIVVEAVFVDPMTCADRLADGARWVREPLAEWLAERWGPDAARGYAYDVRGTRREDLAVERTSAAPG